MDHRRRRAQGLFPVLDSAYRCYGFAFDVSAHRSGTRAYGTVIAFNDGGVGLFDVAKVQLVYRYAVLK